MTDFTALEAEAQKLIDAVAAEMADLEAEIAAAKADEQRALDLMSAAVDDYNGALAQIAVLKSMNDTDHTAIASQNAIILKLQAQLDAVQAAFDAYKATHPDPVVVPPPPPPPPPPVPSAFPDATNTGYKTTLTPFTGSLTVSKAGTVIENKKITGSLRVTAANVIIRNCQILSGDYWGINADGTSGLLVQDTTITGNGNSIQNGCVLTGTAGKVYRCNLSGFENGIVMQDGACVAEDNYIHDLMAGPDGHFDCVSVQGGQTGAIVRHNTLIGWNTSAVIIKSDFGPVTNTLVENNLIKNQAGKMFSYPLYSVNGNKGPTPTGTKFLNNIIEKGAYGYFSTEGTVTKQGNVDYVTGAPVNG